MDKRAELLGKEDITKLLIKFSLPAIVGMVVNATYNIIDSIVVGQFIGKKALTAVTLGLPFMLLMLGLYMLVGIGSSALISIRLGENKKEDAEIVLGNAVTIVFIISAMIAGFGLLFLTPFINTLNVDNEIKEYTFAFLQIILVGGIFQGIGFGINNSIRAEGNPNIAMLTMGTSAILNAVLCYLFVAVFKMGVRGSAIATVASQGVSTVWVLIHFTFSNKSILKIRLKNLKLKSEYFLKILAIGSAPFAMQAAAGGLIFIINYKLMSYGGSTDVAIYGIINRVALFILMPIFGINQGVQPILGYNYGAKRFDRVKEALTKAIIAATVITTLGFIIIELFPSQIIYVFNKDDAELAINGANAIRIFLIMLPIIGFQIVSSTYFMAIGKPAQSMFLGLSRQVLFFIPALFILPLFWGVTGIFLSGPFADITSSVVTAILLVSELRRLDRKHENSDYALNNPKPSLES